MSLSTIYSWEPNLNEQFIGMFLFPAGAVPIKRAAYKPFQWCTLGGKNNDKIWIYFFSYSFSDSGNGAKQAYCPLLSQAVSITIWPAKR